MRRASGGRRPASRTSRSPTRSRGSWPHGSTCSSRRPNGSSRARPSWAGSSGRGPSAAWGRPPTSMRCSPSSRSASWCCPASALPSRGSPSSSSSTSSRVMWPTRACRSGNARRRTLPSQGGSNRRQALKRAERFGEEALHLARDDHERSIALEALGDAFLTDYVGDLAWKYYRESAHARAAVAEVSNDLKVAYLCARACEVPTRWPGSMRRIPDSADVEPLLALGMSHLPEGDSEERVRLQSIRASWPFAFPDPPMNEEEALDCERLGLEAADMALRLGMYDLASGALDASGGFGISRGLYARVRKIQERRLDILPHVSDQLEIGDAYAMIAWSDHELGQYREGLGSAEEGVRLVEGTWANAAIHAASGQVVVEYRVGEWDRALVTFERVKALLDDRRDDPPYFATHAFGAAGIIAYRRDDSVQSDRMTGLLVPLGGGFSTRLLPWLVLLLVERGDLAPARDLLEHLPPAWRVHTTEVLEARCEFVAVAG